MPFGHPRFSPLFQLYFSQVWLPTVQLVLQADWQEAWHSPQPPFLMVLWSVGLLTVLICFIVSPPPFRYIFILPFFSPVCKRVTKTSFPLRPPALSFPAQESAESEDSKRPAVKTQKVATAFSCKYRNRQAQPTATVSSYHPC